MGHRSFRFAFVLAVLASSVVNSSCFLQRSGTDTSTVHRMDWDASLTPRLYCIGDPMALSWNVGEPLGCRPGESSCQTVEMVDLDGPFGTTPNPHPSGRSEFPSSRSAYRFRFTVTHATSPDRFTWQERNEASSAIQPGGAQQPTSFGAMCNGTYWSTDRFQAVIPADDYGACVHVRQVCNPRTNPQRVIVSSTAGGADVWRIDPGRCEAVDWPKTDLIILAQFETAYGPPGRRCAAGRGTLGEVLPAAPQPEITLTLTFDCDPSRPEECRPG